MTEAFNAHDPKAWTQLCKVDVQLVTARGEVMSGVAEIEKGLTTLFQTRNRAARARTLDVNVRFITADVAVAHVTNELVASSVLMGRRNDHNESVANESS